MVLTKLVQLEMLLVSPAMRGYSPAKQQSSGEVGSSLAGHASFAGL